MAGIPLDLLSLCLEPEGAVIAAMSEATPEIQRKLVVGSGVMILDCGGGTVDITVSSVTSTEPYSLQEILPASGDAWGGTLVDAEYRKFANTLLCPPGADGMASGQRADPAALAAMMDSWETAKVGWDPADPGRAVVKVGGLAGVCEAVGGPEFMQTRVTAFNEANGFSGAEAVVYKPRAFALWLPPALVQSFFDRCVTNISAHVLNLFAEAEDVGHPVHFVFLVGGFAESVYLQRSIRAALKIDPESPPLAELVVPNKPVQSVNRGSALWALYPKFITARISRHTYCVRLAEPYDPNVHDPLPHRRYLQDSSSGGKYARNVLVPLVQRGDEIATDMSVQQEVCPLLDSQIDVTFDLYRLDCRLPPLDGKFRRTFVYDDDLPEPPAEHLQLCKDEAGMVKALAQLKSGLNKLVKAVGRRQKARLRAGGALTDSAAAEAGLPDYLPFVKLHDRLATVSVDIGTTADHPGRNGRLATLSLFFGRTEITTVATAKNSGAKREVTITYES